METAKDILLATIPALLVLITAYFSIRQSFKNEWDKRRNEIALANSKTITAIRLQAYERLTLFLERISVESLIMRTNKAGIDAKTLQSALLATIRAEFDHNLAQQIYVSPQLWEVLKNAKTNTIKDKRDNKKESTIEKLNKLKDKVAKDSGDKLQDKLGDKKKDREI